MDTSKEYIKMCEKAIEIQNSAEASKQYAFPYDKVYVTKDSNSYERFYQYKHQHNIWLPRQDQLQEMIGNPTAMSLQLYFNNWFDERYCKNEGYTIEECEAMDKLSLEQIWLMFVMQEKYNKTWNGKDWNENSKNK